MGDLQTRLWGQRLTVADGAVELLGEIQLLLESSGLWWAPSFVDGATLIEGPELVYRDGWYYLFFAGGRFCTDSYIEGVARSRHVFGPYEAMGVPLLTTGLVSRAWGDERIIGPGHASFVRGPGLDEWYVAYHASNASACTRYAFIERMRFSTAGWPYVDFARGGSSASRHMPVVPPPPHSLPALERSGACRIVAPCRRLAFGLPVGSSSFTCNGHRVRPVNEAALSSDIVPVCTLDENTTL